MLVEEAVVASASVNKNGHGVALVSFCNPLREEAVNCAVCGLVHMLCQVLDLKRLLIWIQWIPYVHTGVWRIHYCREVGRHVRLRSVQPVEAEIREIDQIRRNHFWIGIRSFEWVVDETQVVFNKPVLDYDQLTIDIPGSDHTTIDVRGKLVVENVEVIAKRLVLLDVERELSDKTTVNITTGQHYRAAIDSDLMGREETDSAHGKNVMPCPRSNNWWMTGTNSLKVKQHFEIVF